MKPVRRWAWRALVILLAFAAYRGICRADLLLKQRSYGYLCWRVGHPLGVSSEAYAEVLLRTRPSHIPHLISLLDGSDAWWVQQLLHVWFRAASDQYNRLGSPPSPREYWAAWWAEHAADYPRLCVVPGKEL